MNSIKLRDVQNSLDHMCDISFTKDTDHRRMVAIVGTLGNSSRNVETISQLIKAGMNIVRINFSHESREDHLLSLKCIREAVEICAKEQGYFCPVAIAGDLKGREIRTGQFASRKPVELKRGDIIKLTINEDLINRGTKDVFYIDYPAIIKNVEVGQHVFIDDNAISVQINEVGVDCLTCRVLIGGILRGNVTVVVPGSALDLPAVSEKDADDIKFCLENNFDFLFLSKIRNAKEVEEIRALTNTARGRHIKLFTKLENIEALENLDEILSVSDGVIFARTDLSIELNVVRVFVVQKAIIARCNRVGKPVICATHFLMTMNNSPIPKSTDIVDIGNAVLDGADALLLSSETAIGNYPVDALKTLARTCREAEAVLWHRKLFKDLIDHNPGACDGAHALAISAVLTSMNVSATAILMVTVSGKSAQLLSMYRPRCPIFAITRCSRVARQIGIYRGIIPILIPASEYENYYNELEKRINYTLTVAQRLNVVKNNDAIVVLSPSKNTTGFTNNIFVIYACFEKSLSDFTFEKKSIPNTMPRRI